MRVTNNAGGSDQFQLANGLCDPRVIALVVEQEETVFKDTLGD